MNRREFLRSVVLTGAAFAVAANRPWTTIGQTTPPPPRPAGLPYLLQHKVTVADRAAAAARAKALRYQPGAVGMKAMLKAGVSPHYFGPFANYANSPLPTGGVGSITLDAGGSGYSAPVVTIADVYGTGSGATATTTVSDGVITKITLVNNGSGYSAPIVVIEDSTGSGAAATAVIGGDLSGGIRKFVDSVAGLNLAGANTLGEYIPVAIADTDTFSGSDYYEIELGQYTQQMHRDLPPTPLRGYRQTNTTDTSVSQFHYLGPLIVAKRDVPVRIKFTNNLPIGSGGDLFIPVDETVMGAGMGPLNDLNDPTMKEKFTQNRATIHNHGALTPWISDGTPHQWTTPAGETTQYPKGVSVVNVPDMWFDATTHQPVPAGTQGATNDPGDGSLTFYYTNQQSARLMFYHDHAYGITRLNVYSGEAAGYLLTDDVEADLIGGTNVTGVNPGLMKILPDIGIPLILQDKTFVDAKTIAAQDPTWRWGGEIDQDGKWQPKTGDLWVPSVYMPAQNPYDLSGANPFGRWQYGPWFWPPTSNITFGPIPNEYYDPINAPWEPPMRPAMPTPSMGMEAFNDTTLVNGTVYPYMEVEPRAYRFRILNAANDRFFNLHFYEADPDVVTTDGRRNTEMRMVPAITTPGFPASWPSDGRAGGVPDPETAGPSWIQLGTEGGFLPAPVIIPPQPIAWNGNPLAFNFGNVTDHSLLLGCAERADVIVDFSQHAGKTLILYNDAPAAFPALDPRYDFYTDNPDQTSTGGTPPTQPGFGPNTRTIMQVRVKSFDPNGDAVASISVLNGGLDYLVAPLVELSGGSGSGSIAKAFCAIDHITVLDLGAGYMSAKVAITGGGGSGATAKAKVSNGRVIGITVTNPGYGYTSAPTVEIMDAGDPEASGWTGGPDPHQVWLPLVVGGTRVPGSGATAKATLTVTAITVTNGGSGYTAVPDVNILGGGGYGAVAQAHLALGTSYDLAGLESVFAMTDTKRGAFEVSQDPIIIPQAAYNSAYNKSFPADASTFILLQDFSKSFFNGPLTGLILTDGGSGYTSAPDVTISGGGGTGALATATIDPDSGYVVNLTLTNPGTGYTSAPTISFSNGGGSGAAAEATGFTMALQPKGMHDEMGAAYDVDFGRMSGALGLELPKVNSLNQNLVLYGYASPPVDHLQNSMTPLGTLGDGTQLWKITHNGVDTHPIHFHLVNVQVVNRVAWDGALLPPEPNELGWKETIRTNPLEHLIVAMRPVAPTLPFDLPNSIRPIDPTVPLGEVMRGGPAGFIDPGGTAVPVVNHLVNFGWEYVWHCHILSHEEMDMMHALTLVVAPAAPTALTADATVPGVVGLSWTDNSINETSFVVQRADSSLGPWFTLSAAVAFAPGKDTTVTYDDTTVASGATYVYRVLARNTVGDTTAYVSPAIGYPTKSADSAPSNEVTVILPG
jgi:FtsP/CotA-like multicopper oxidase with cupredoxin domain